MNEGKFFKFEKQPEEEEKEKELNPEEIGEFGQEMDEYAQAMKQRIKEIKEELAQTQDEARAEELRAELEFIEEQGVADMGEIVHDIESGEMESITEKPAKKE